MLRAIIGHLFVVAAVAACGSPGALFGDPPPSDGGAGRRDAAHVVAPTTPRDAATTNVDRVEGGPRDAYAGDEGEDAAADVETIDTAAPMSAIDAGPDAGPDAREANPPDTDVLCQTRCAAAGLGVCVSGECVIRCDEKNDCTDRVECPAGVPCRVVCATKGACSGGIDCTQATRCDIQCSGSDSCSGAVQCGGALCRVACAEHGTCARPVDCSADECQLSCTGMGACGGGIGCLAAANKCGIDCGGPGSCGGTVRGAGVSQLLCSGFGSCATSVSCAGESCGILCMTNQSCGGAVCCQSAQCDYQGTTRRCQ